MKSITKIFSFMLVGVLLLTGSIVLSGCFKKDDELTKQEKVEIVMAVFNDAKAKTIQASEFEVGQEIEYNLSYGKEVFTKYGSYVNENKKLLSTITQDYYDTYIDSDRISDVLDFCIEEVLTNNNFDFGAKQEIQSGDDYNVSLSIEYNDSYIRILQYVESLDGEVGLMFWDISYSNKSAISWEVFDQDDWMIFKFSTDAHRAYDYIEIVNKRPLDNNNFYYCEIYSEINGYYFDISEHGEVGDMSFNSQLVPSNETFGEMATQCKEKIDILEEISNQYINN